MFTMQVSEIMQFFDKMVAHGTVNIKSHATCNLRWSSICLSKKREREENEEMEEKENNNQQR